MPRTVADIEQAKRLELFLLDEQEQDACAHEWARCICFALMTWFIGVVAWWSWPYFLKPDMWPTTLYVLGCIVHGLGYAAAVVGGLIFFAFLLSGGTVLKTRDLPGEE